MNKDIIGTTYLENPASKEKIPVFLEKVNPEDMGKYRSSTERKIAEYAILAIDKEGKTMGRLVLTGNRILKDITTNDKAIEKELNYLTLDWIDTTGASNIKGLGSVLYQVAMEMSFLLNKHGSLHLRSINSARGFHYLMGATTYTPDQYQSIADDIETGERLYRKKAEHYGDISPKDLLHSNTLDGMTAMDLVDGLVMGNASGHPFSSTGAQYDETPMRMSEHGKPTPNTSDLVFDKNDSEISEDWLKDSLQKDYKESIAYHAEFLEWMEKNGKILRSKVYWINKIRKSPILSQMRNALENNAIVMD